MSAATITITQAQLEAALAGWERDARGGNRISEEERAAMTPEEIGAASAPYLFNALQQKLEAVGSAGMSADRYWQRHGRMGMRVNDNDAVPDNETRATIYAAGRSTDHQPYPFFIALGVRAGGMSFDASMSPAMARELAAALMSAADDCDLQQAAAAAMPVQVAA